MESIILMSSEVKYINKPANHGNYCVGWQTKVELCRSRECKVTPRSFLLGLLLSIMEPEKGRQMYGGIQDALT